MTEHNNLNFLSIMQSVDAFFPIGGFTLSNGLEDYVVRERISSGEELADYLDGFLQIFAYNDLGLLSLAYRYGSDETALLRLDAVAAAAKAASEIRTGSSRMCVRYIKARDAMKDCPQQLEWYHQKIKANEATGFHPIALGIYGSSCKMDEHQLLTMYGYSVISAIVNNAVKLVPLSQMEGQRILYEHLDRIEQVVRDAMQINELDIGISGATYEIHCMNHEVLYSRQYMS